MKASLGRPNLANLFSGAGAMMAEDGPGEGFLGNALGEHAIVSVADVTGRIVYVNRKFTEISGYSRDELIGRNHRILKSGEHSPQVYREMWRTIANGRTWQGEIKNLRKSGEPYWVKATIVPFLDAEGKPEKYLSIRTDITEIKAAEAQRQQQLSFDMIEGEIYLFWPECLKVFYANRSARIRLRALGLAMGDLTPFELLHGLSEDEFRAHLASLMAGQRKRITFEAIQQGPDGRTNPTEVAVQLIRPDGETPRFLAHIRNISQRKQAEAAKQQFLANISHELKTPLTTIKGAFALIKAGLTGNSPERAGQLSDMGLKNAARLERLIEDVLDMEQIASGRTVLKLTTVDISALIARAVRDIADYRPGKGVRIQCCRLEAPICVRGDEVWLAKVLSTLLSNAVKFSHQGGQVSISAKRDGARVSVAVTDQGVGIPEHAMHNIFKPFSQADTSDRRPSDGAGLGLSIARAIVKEHGGSIDVKSVEGKGTEVSFYLIPSPEGDPA